MSENLDQSGDEGILPSDSALESVESDAEQAMDSTNIAPDTADATPRQMSRREIMSAKANQSRRNRPWILAGVLILVGIAAIPAWAFINEFVLPPREKAVRVEDRTYTRGEVVDFIRFHQRLTEEVGEQFELGASLFSSLQTISENEMAFQGAPGLGVTVTELDIDQEIRRLLGFGYITEANRTKETDVQAEEAQFQFLNRVGLSEETYREIIQKGLFRSGVRDRVGENVPLIQQQVHVYRIILEQHNEDIRNRIAQRVAAGESFSDLAFEYSVDSEVRRGGGDEGWLPAGVITQFDPLFFGLDDDGNRILPLGQVSEIVQIPDEGSFGVLFISEYSPARQIDLAPLELLKDQALTDWFQEFRSKVDVELVLNSSIADWVNEQVRVASALPTPGPDDNNIPDGFSLDESGQLVPASAP
ncbi:MAG: peptidylprolyl isomerase [Chloroflexi bacterium]|nr:peptidylprolyl isomerase [Chloroflexota bacterium]